jgi:hypothetical protein
MDPTASFQGGKSVEIPPSRQPQLQITSISATKEFSPETEPIDSMNSTAGVVELGTREDSTAVVSVSKASVSIPVHPSAANKTLQSTPLDTNKKDSTPSKKSMPVNPFANHANSNPTRTVASNPAASTTKAVVNESTKSLPERLRDFYSVHNPSKIDSIPEILEKYKGKENELLVGLRRRYHVSNI